MSLCDGVAMYSWSGSLFKHPTHQTIKLTFCAFLMQIGSGFVFSQISNLRFEAYMMEDPSKTIQGFTLWNLCLLWQKEKKLWIR